MKGAGRPRPWAIQKVRPHPRKANNDSSESTADAHGGSGRGAKESIRRTTKKEEKKIDKRENETATEKKRKSRERMDHYDTSSTG